VHNHKKLSVYLKFSCTSLKSRKRLTAKEVEKLQLRVANAEVIAREVKPTLLILFNIGKAYFKGGHAREVKPTLLILFNYGEAHFMGGGGL
jgi:hypothetical protein